VDKAMNANADPDMIALSARLAFMVEWADAREEFVLGALLSEALAELDRITADAPGSPEA